MREKNDFHLIELADLFRLKFLQDAQFSPSGKEVVYTVSHVNPTTEEEHSSVWLLSLDLGLPRQLTTGQARDTNPQWSPDGTRIAFLSTRAGKSQIYLMSVSGGEAQPLTDMGQGVSGNPVWSPDGKHIAFAANSVLEPVDLTRPYRITRPIYRFDAAGYLKNIVLDIYVVSTAGGDSKQLTHDDSQNCMPLWSPTGNDILFTSAEFPGSQWGCPTARIVSLNGEIHELIEDWGCAISASWSAEGEQVVFIGKPSDRSIASKNDLWVVNAHGGRPTCRTPTLAFHVGGGLQADMPMYKPFPCVLVSADHEVAYVQVQEKGTVAIYQVALDGPESWTAIVTGERTCIPLDIHGSHLLFAVSTLDNPIDLFITPMAGLKEQRLTNLNAHLLAARTLPTVEHIAFSGSDGEHVEGWIMKPRIGEAPYPTILYIHGGPHSAFGHVFSFDFQMLAGAGYAVLFVNQRGSSGYGNKFSSAIIGDWGNLDYKDLMSGVEFAIKGGIVDPDHLGCCGLSAGGNLTCWIVGHTDRFKAAVAENPLTNWASAYGVSDVGTWMGPNEMGGLPHEIPDVYRRCSPITHAHRCTTPTLLVQGEQDYHCPAEQSEQFYSVLKASGCIAEMVRLPGGSHSSSIRGTPILRRVQNEVLLGWMNEYVMGLVYDEKERCL